MSDCVECSALLRKHANEAPHAALRLTGLVSRADGELETYRCRACRAQWQRLLASAALGGKPQLWTRLGEDN